ncbi:MAG: flippase-like domain-containing protein [Lachnospiraceae bacterium]|nr:flippase-like domain-containing protein [Lachnospiraceae bacterium]
MKRHLTKRLILSILIFVICIGLTILIILMNVKPKVLAKSLMAIDKTYIILGMFFMLLYSLIEAISIKMLLSRMHIRKPLFSCMKYAIIGFFFSGVTPSSSGGQSMQMVYMRNDDIQYSDSSFTLLVLLFCYQIVIGIYGTIGYIVNFNELQSIFQSLNVWFFIAIMIDLAIVFFVGTLIFKWQLAERIMYFIKKVCYMINSKLGDRINDKINAFIDRYRNSSEHINKDKRIIFRVLCNTFIQYILLYSIPFFVYKGLGNSGFPYIPMLMLQAVLYIGCGFVPVPGALAVTESLFILIFSNYFSHDDIGNAVIISRAISLYLPVIFYGILSAWWMKSLPFEGKNKVENNN